MKKYAAIFTVLGLSLALTACTSGANSVSGVECTKPGDASKTVEVAGKFGAEPKIKVGEALKVSSTERSVAIEGDGEETAVEGLVVEVSYAVFHGSTGEERGSTGFGEEANSDRIILDEAQSPPFLIDSLTCSVAGDRVVAVSPASDVFGANTAAAGFEEGDAVIFVFDVVSISKPDKPVDAAADMVMVAPDAEGMPVVEYAEDGRPTVSIPDSEPLERLTMALITEGNGDVVAAGDTVEVHYTGVNWTTESEFDSSWKRGEPTQFPTNGVIPGFGAALVGQAVGSQVVVVIPPAYGYGEAGQSGAGISGTDTLVFVVDIIGTTPAGS